MSLSGHKLVYFLSVLLFLGVLISSKHSKAAEVNCLDCHPDLGKGKVVHPAVQMGCTGCHTGVDASNIPHVFKGKKGLSSAPPELCFGCHDKSAFTKKDVHPPVAAGDCLSCHTPHSGPNESLLLNNVNSLCGGCHPDLSFHNHPLQGAKDPKRNGKTFTCVSCHNPHSSDWGKLFRYEADSSIELCAHCHKF